MMVSLSFRWRAALVAALLSLSAGCSYAVEYRGYSKQTPDLDRLAIGMTRGDVEAMLGTPTLLNPFDDGGAYYISETVDYRILRAPTTVERRIVALYFDDRDALIEIRKFGLEDGARFSPSDEKTPAGAKTPTFFDEMFGNLGRFGGVSTTGTSKR